MGFERSCENCKRYGQGGCQEPCATCIKGGEFTYWESIPPEPDKAKELADEHWAYVKEVLGLHVSSDSIIGEIGFHYKTAFVHGYKHGKEDS